MSVFRKDRGNKPVFVVMGVALVALAVFFWISLVVVPNRKLRPVLEAERNRLREKAIGERELIENMASLEDSRKSVEKALNAFEAELGPLAKKDTEKELALRELFQKGIAKKSLSIGSQVRDEKRSDWYVTPFELEFSGSKEALFAALGRWRRNLSPYVRILEVDLKVADGKKDKSYDLWIQGQAHVLIPAVLLKNGKFFNQTLGGLTIPEGRFEGKELKALRAEIALLNQEMSVQEARIAPFKSLAVDQKRLESIQETRAHFISEHEREFDLLEAQLREKLPKLESGQHHRFILRVEETLLEKKKAL